MSYIVTFILGSWFGVILMCILAIGRDSDEIEESQKEDNNE